MRRGGVELEVERDGVDDGFFSFREIDFEVDVLGRVIKSEFFVYCVLLSVEI